MKKNSSRSKLAAAFIVTTSVAGFTGCATSNPAPVEPTRNPPAQQRQYDDRGVPVDLRPDEVNKRDDGTCYYEADIDCPPPEEATCNPPAPIQVDCPSGT